MYKFETRLTPEHLKEMGHLADYDIFVSDEKDSDNIGSHIQDVDKVMRPLGIYGEDQENCFSGFFNEKVKNLDDLNNYLSDAGWTYLGEFVE